MVNSSDAQIRHIGEAKAKAYNTFIEPQAAYGSCSGAFLSQTKRAYSL